MHMTPEALVELLNLLEAGGVETWLDGGWGVDALLGVQTRSHKDADLVVRVSDLDRLRQLLGTKGFSVRPGGTPSNFVLANGAALEIDIHAIVFDASGNGVYRMANGEDWSYPAEGFTGRGTIDGRPSRCLSAAAQVLGHATGYVPTEKDIVDMEHLRARFGVTLPAHLRRTNAP
jgi:lincosamide nucleotidyltransferase A/C/D/E